MRVKKTDCVFEKRNPEKKRKKKQKFQKNFKMLKNGLRFLKTQKKTDSVFLETEKKRIPFCVFKKPQSVFVMVGFFGIF